MSATEGARPSRRARILHLPWNTGGNPVGLSRGERDLGLESDVAVMEMHEFGYEADIDIGAGGAQTLRTRTRKARFLLWAARRYDVFHYNFGGTLFVRLSGGRFRSEVPWLKRRGKVVLATFQGDDARPPSENPHGPQDPGYLEMQRLWQAPRRRLMLDHADRVFFVNPDLRRWLPGAEFRPYASVDPRRVERRPPPEGDEVVVVHAPSDRGVKGTERVIESVEALRSEGLPVRLDLVEGVQHREAMERFARADLAVDQLNLGWYGGFAVEMMAIGRPVVCRISEREPGDNPFGERLPIVRSDAASLPEVLRGLVADRERRLRIGEESRRFAEEVHDPRAVARSNLDGLVDLPRP